MHTIVVCCWLLQTTGVANAATDKSVGAERLILLQGGLPLQQSWSVEEGVELHAMPFSKPLGAVLAGHPWYLSMSCSVTQQAACTSNPTVAVLLQNCFFKSYASVCMAACVFA